MPSKRAPKKAASKPKPAKTAAAKRAAPAKAAPKAKPTAVAASPVSAPEAWPAPAPPPAAVPAAAPQWTSVPEPAPSWTFAPVQAPQPPVRPLQPAGSLAGALVILLMASVFASALTLLLEFLIPEWGRPDAQGAIGLADGLVSLVSGGLSIALTVVFCLWIYRILVNARQRHPQTDIKPGWAVGSFFIPFAHLFVPYFEVRRAYAADVSPQTGPVTAWFVPWALSIALAYVTAPLAVVVAFRAAFASVRDGAADAQAAVSEVYDELRPWLLAFGALSLILQATAAYFLVRLSRQWTALQEGRPVS